MMTYAFTFDLEGTILNLEPVHRQTWLEVGNRFGIVDFDILPRLLGVGDRAIATDLASLTGHEVDELLTEKDTLFWDLIGETVTLPPRDGWQECFEQITAAGHTVAIGSLTPRTSAEILLERSGLSNVVPRKLCVFAEDVRRIKPYPDVFLETAKRLNVSTAQQRVFEDSVPGVEAAVAAGSAVIAVPVYYDETAEELAQAGAGAVYSGWREAVADAPRWLADE